MRAFLLNVELNMEYTAIIKEMFSIAGKKLLTTFQTHCINR